MISVIEVTVPGCVECAKFKKFWESVKAEYPDVQLREVDATTLEGMELVQKHVIFASPGILINDELFSTGGVNRDAFVKKLKELASKTDE